MQLTTLQMANLAATIANRGYYYTPHFAKAFLKNGTLIDKPNTFLQKIITPVNTRYFPPIVHGMELVVSAGTARGAFVEDIPIAGKTGTVQNPHGEDHSTFIGFAPVDDPQIAIAVYVEKCQGRRAFCCTNCQPAY
ncbi:MAG: penicillin-binding transpeptidase domain-containing protein [Saprospiraceae bacterium]